MSTPIHHPPFRSVKDCREKANSLILRGEDHVMARHLLAWCEIAEGKTPHSLFEELRNPCPERLRIPPSVNLGWLMSQCGKTIEGLNRLHEDLEMEPGNSNLRLLAGICLLRSKNWGAAKRVLQPLVDEDPENALSNQYYSQALLSDGDWKEGFSIGKRGGQLTSLEKEFFEEPTHLWMGQDLRNKYLVLVGSDLPSDYFLYLRYLPLLQQFGGPSSVGIVCDSDRYVPLFRTIRSVMRVDVKEFDHFDYFLPFRQLPMVFGTEPNNVPPPTTPFKINTRHVQEKRSRLRFGKPLLGLVWRSPQAAPLSLENALGPAALNHSELQEILDELSPRYQIVSFQEDATDEETSLLEKYGAHSLRKSDLRDYLAMAEWMTSLHSMLAVDSAAGHLAASLGIDCHFLVGYSASWIWNHHPQSTPWWPHAALYRQRSENRWLECFRDLFRTLQGNSAFLAAG